MSDRLNFRDRVHGDDDDDDINSLARVDITTVRVTLRLMWVLPNAL